MITKEVNDWIKKVQTGSYFSTEEAMEKFVEQTLLYDFYGELLTEHQKQIYEDVVFHDLSLSEVA